jgi:peptidoglycan/xylan/chitin deacetylase (PgdA/CDA1 family)
VCYFLGRSGKFQNKKGNEIMKAQNSKVIYIMEAGCELMDKIRQESNYWAERDENICLTFDDAMEVEELVPLLKEFDGGCDVIVSL